MASLSVQLGRVKAMNTRLAQYANNLDDTQTLEEFESRLAKLDDNWKEFFTLFDQITEESDDTVANDSEVTDFENKYYSTRAILLRSIKAYQLHAASQRLATPADNTAQRVLDLQTKFFENFNGACLSGSSTEHQLPKITIKSFSGDYCDWKSFHDLYVSSVHKNARLTASQKFHYLKSFLLNEPATLLKHIAITDDNYVEAWAKLIKRYNKPGRIAHSFVAKFLQLPTISQPNVNDLRPFTDSVDEILRGLRALDSKAESRDVWLIHMLLNKVDESTQRMWAEYILSTVDNIDPEFPTVEEFITFLEHRCSSLEVNHKSTTSKSHSRSMSHKPNINRSHTHTVKTFHISTSCCPKCKSNHSLNACQQFLSLSVQDRRAFILTQSLCLNCLRHGHKEPNCKSTFNCRKCNKRHHTLIHPVSVNQHIQHSTPETTHQSTFKPTHHSTRTSINSSGSNQQEYVPASSINFTNTSP